MDRIQPKDIEGVKILREWEEKHVPKTASDEKFKKFKNYYAPKEIVKNSTRVLSFGVGNDIRFEKAIYTTNNNLQINLYDPTPLTIKFLKDNVRYPFFTFHPIAYSPTNGTQKFYFPSNDPSENCFSLKKFPEWAENIKSVNVKCKNLKTIMLQKK